MSETPKPCPFCGEGEHIYPAYRLDKAGKCVQPPYAIDCIMCGVDLTPREGRNAIEAWNRRAGINGDLYAALAKFVEHFGDPFMNARAALAKARGETP